MVAKSNKWALPHIYFLLLYGGCNVILFFETFHFLHIALIWNVFLAFLPLVFANLALRKKQNGKKIWLFLAFLWLIFWPNTFYLATDMIHVSKDVFMTVIAGEPYTESDKIIYTTDLLLWAKVFTISLGMIYSAYTGVKSFCVVQTEIKQTYGNPWMVVATVFLAMLGGFAIYIGRFIRLNSWDILKLFHLNSLMMDSGHSPIFVLRFILLVAGYILILSVFYHWFQQSEVK